MTALNVAVALLKYSPPAAPLAAAALPLTVPPLSVASPWLTASPPPVSASLSLIVTPVKTAVLSVA